MPATTRFVLPVPRHASSLSPGFMPAALWNRAYREAAAHAPRRREITLSLAQDGGFYSHYTSPLLPADHPDAPLTLRYVERMLKFLLWQRGAARVAVTGAPEIVPGLASQYAPGGARAFDAAFMGDKVYRRPFVIETAPTVPTLTATGSGVAQGGHLDGCRIGFDLGGSDRKAAAVIDGNVVYSEEIPWDPYFQSDPAYHLEGIHDSLRRAAAHLPRVDAIGGSAAGVYVNNEVRVASLFRGVSPDDFDRHIRRIFFTLQERWGGIPFVVINDGEVTALAGAMALRDHSVLGISMGTSQAGGYVTPQGNLTPWLNELAFAPVDYDPGAPADEWSGDVGCGVQYFSQQGVARLAAAAGFSFPPETPLAARLVAVQEAFAAGNPAAIAVFETVGTALGYSLAHYADFYPLRHVLILGRVTSGPAGEHLLQRARAVLAQEFPDIAAQIKISLPDETSRRHGQAVAAASLPRITPSA